MVNIKIGKLVLLIKTIQLGVEKNIIKGHAVVRRVSKKELVQVI